MTNKEKRQKKVALGIDLGGTFIKSAIVDETGEILSEMQVRTPPGRDVHDIVGEIVKLIGHHQDRHPEIEGIGVGSPGLVDETQAIIRLSPNFPDWNDVHLRSLIAKGTSLPVFLENDVNCFVLAEQRWGAGRKFQNVLGLALGTGIGGGIVIDNKLYRGCSGAAGELGHISVDLWGPKCNCGNRGCVERYLGRQWFIQAARDILDNEEIKTPKQVSELADSGDQTAIKFLEDRGFILGVACTSLIHIFDPQSIVIGGGIAQCGEPLFRGIRKCIEKRAYAILAEKVKILPAELGTNAGAMGAAAVAFEMGNIS
ncbi:glucokinase [candidate division LCP-89 bacterium B3_LCP]|uniref:Glucokinase n=1 Tax=candidate division LCP-89 bacterium B3_LCP TaxID=2012998 RepID=A0A532UXS4_UNCL8|nr:MAG: glucokinase [candidate division LCP-89 bacterium B3_LCP]